MIKLHAMKSHAALLVKIWLIIFTLEPTISAEDMRLGKMGTNTIVLFASVETAKTILMRHDNFVSALSPFNRAARMKTNRAVSEQEYLRFVGENVMPWLPEETNKITSVFQIVEKKVAPWHLPFPPTILLIKTSGREEGEATYTRQNAVVFLPAGHPIRKIQTKEFSHS